MITACIILSGLALLTAVTFIVLFFMEKKRNDRRHKAMLDYLRSECNGAIDVAEDYTDDAMKEFRNNHQNVLESFSDAIHAELQRHSEKIKNLEDGICPDYEKSLEAAKAVNDFSAGITSILGFDPVATERARRHNSGREGT